MRSLTFIILFTGSLSSLLEKKNLCAETAAKFGRRYACDGEVPVGEGGFGKVFVVTRQTDSAKFALKVQGFPSVASPEEQELHDYLKAQAIQEYKVLESCHHKNLIRLVQSVHLPDGMAAVMEFADGGSLESLLDKRGSNEFGPDHPEQVLTVFQAVLEGVHQIHQCGFIHRDIKPNNIMFKSGVVKLIDLGIAIAKDSDQSYVSGDIDYLDPMADRVGDFKFRWTPASDVYSLGVLLHYMALKKLPYKNKLGEHQFQFQLAQESPSVTLPAGTDLTIAWLVSRMILLEPTSRIGLEEALEVTGSFLKGGRRNPLPADVIFSNKGPIGITKAEVLQGHQAPEEDAEGRDQLNHPLHI